jgi:hypothetical protein
LSANGTTGNAAINGFDDGLLATYTNTIMVKAGTKDSNIDNIREAVIKYIKNLKLTDPDALAIISVPYLTINDDNNRNNTPLSHSLVKLVALLLVNGISIHDDNYAANADALVAELAGVNKGNYIDNADAYIERCKYINDNAIRYVAAAQVAFGILKDIDIETKINEAAKRIDDTANAVVAALAAGEKDRFIVTIRKALNKQFETIKSIMIRILEEPGVNFNKVDNGNAVPGDQVELRIKAGQKKHNGANLAADNPGYNLPGLRYDVDAKRLATIINPSRIKGLENLNPKYVRAALLMSGTKRVDQRKVYTRLCAEVEQYDIKNMNLSSLASIRDPNYVVAVKTNNNAKNYLYRYVFTREKLINYLMGLPKLVACLGYANPNKTEAEMDGYAGIDSTIIESLADALLNGYQFTTFGIFRHDLRTTANDTIKSLTADNVIGQEVIKYIDDKLSKDLVAIDEYADINYPDKNAAAGQDPLDIVLDSNVNCNRAAQQLVVRRLLRSPNNLLDFYNKHEGYKNYQFNVDTMITQAQCNDILAPAEQTKFKEIINDLNKDNSISPAGSLPSTSMFLKFVHHVCKYLTDVNTKMANNKQKLLGNVKGAIPNDYSYFATMLMSNSHKLNKFIHPFKYEGNVAALNNTSNDVNKLRDNANLSVNNEVIIKFITMIINYLETKNVKVDEAIVNASKTLITKPSEYKKFVTAKPSAVYNELFAISVDGNKVELNDSKNKLDLVNHIVKFAVIHQIIDALSIKKSIEKNIIAKRNEVIVENPVTFKK